MSDSNHSWSVMVHLIPGGSRLGSLSALIPDFSLSTSLGLACGKAHGSSSCPLSFPSSLSGQIDASLETPCHVAMLTPSAGPWNFMM